MTAAWPALILLTTVVAFTAGWLVSRNWFSRLARAAGLRASRQHTELEELRRQYRRRRLAMREALRRRRRTQDGLRQALAEKDGLIATERRIAADLQVRAAVAETRVAELEALSGSQAAEIESLRAEMQATCAKISATEVVHGLLRIEHGELLARTQRVRALVEASAVNAAITMPNPGAPPSSAELARSDAGALRAGIAEREARIQELARKLEDSEGRAAGLDTQLLTWKHRIAPLVLQLRIQRERNRKLRRLLKGDHLPAAPAPEAAPPADNPTDDLKQIRGIGPSIERKLHSQGIFRFRQLAELNPMELATIAARLSIPSKKPWRDRWIEQARALTERSNAA